MKILRAAAVLIFCLLCLFAAALSLILYVAPLLFLLELER